MHYKEVIQVCCTLAKHSSRFVTTAHKAYFIHSVEVLFSFVVTAQNVAIHVPSEYVLFD